MNLTHILWTVTNAEPFAWLATLLTLYFCGERRMQRLQGSSLKPVTSDEESPDYRALGAYTVCKFLTSLAYLMFVNEVLPLGISLHAARIANEAFYWTLYFLSTVFVFFIMASILNSSLRPLPGLSSASLIVFRWASFLALVIALTAHLPILGLNSWPLWLDEVSNSFMLCVCTFEVFLLFMLLKQLRRLGLCLRSRPIGLALGITLLGCMDLVSALTLNLPAHIVVWINLLNECVIFFALAMWTFYIIAPEPKRNPPSLSPASKLMKWNEIALKLELGGRQAEHTPFISGVEATVDAILEKFKSRAG